MASAPSSISIDTAFDLDEALTMAEDSCSLQIRSSNSFVAGLPAVISPAVDVVCSVCMEAFHQMTPSSPDVNNKRVPCGHVYHADCIAAWLSRCNSCPLCRYTISFSSSD